MGVVTAVVTVVEVMVTVMMKVKLVRTMMITIYYQLRKRLRNWKKRKKLNLKGQRKKCKQILPKWRKLLCPVARKLRKRRRLPLTWRFSTSESKMFFMSSTNSKKDERKGRIDRSTWSN